MQYRIIVYEDEKAYALYDIKTMERLEYVNEKVNALRKSFFSDIDAVMKHTAIGWLK